uniref:IS110 family transposase n=1 Tax=Escherichia coli TaxID=562 RepID=A0A3G4RWH2_ECOLX|nr:IS110 family transposase [Escherichia coli]
MKYTPVGVDIAKHLIQVHFIDENTGEVVDKQLRGRDFLEYFSNREPCLIGMEACGGSQHWARELTKLGHNVRLLQARFVKAFVMGNKNDVMDARAIWMAVQQPGKEIAVKTEEQQSVLVLHRTRMQLVKFRIAQINALHGTLLEFGETIHKGRASPFQTRRHPRAGNCPRAESLRATHSPEFSPGAWCTHPRHEKHGFRAGAPHTRTETRF